MNYADYESVRPLGDMGARAALLSGRMSTWIYGPDAIFTIEQNGWPGDWEGRAILAQTLLTRLTGAENPFLKMNLDALDAHLNAKGYLGEIMPDGMFNEQQFSGHGWLLRGLCEYYLYSSDKKYLNMAVRIAENLFLPAKDEYATYPCRLEERVVGGEASGNIAGSVGAWKISTDTGCAFIAMDGLSQLYEITGDEKLGDMLDKMYEKFVTIDLSGILAQTHATLTAARAILRLYFVTRDAKYLATARDIFDLYTKRGMTANYANFNWFGRPEWTEPCAIIDSFIVAADLFIYTGDVSYADCARAIWYNGIGRAQRTNGGFGCDSCSGDEAGSGDYISVRTYEASWCCTMRGGEGLSRAARFSYLTEGDTITLPMFTSSIFDADMGGGHIRLRQNAEAAREGRVVIDVEENTAPRSVTLKALMPEWAADGERFKTFAVPEKGGRIEITYNVPVYRRGRRLMWGDLMLGTQGDIKKIDIPSLRRTGSAFKDGNAELEPICDAYKLEAEEIQKRRVKVLFD